MKHAEVEAAVVIPGIRFEDVNLDLSHLKLTGPLGTAELTACEFKLLATLLASDEWRAPMSDIARGAWGHPAANCTSAYRKCGERLGKVLRRVSRHLVVATSTGFVELRRRELE